MAFALLALKAGSWFILRTGAAVVPGFISRSNVCCCPSQTALVCTGIWQQASPRETEGKKGLNTSGYQYLFIGWIICQ